MLIFEEIYCQTVLIYSYNIRAKSWLNVLLQINLTVYIYSNVRVTTIHVQMKDAWYD